MTDGSAGCPGTYDPTRVKNGAVRLRWDTCCTPTVAVVEAVAAATDRDPTDLPLLQRTVDPDALDALFDGEAGPDRSVCLSFTYAGAKVTLGDNGQVTAHPRTERC